MNIIQVGCHTGEDHAYHILNNCINATIVLIDANPYSLEICQSKYKHIAENNNTHFLNYAITPSSSSGTIKFYIPNDDKISAHCSVSTEFLQKHNHETWQEIDVPCKTLDDIISDFRLSTIDYLLIDAEGLDASIILSLDLNKTDIKHIIFEHTHTDGAFSHGSNLEQAVKKMYNHGYSLINHDIYNLEFKKI